jgi:3-hydroxy-5-methyl-1-naphthoate 3-O-methyltransferase
MDVDLTDMTRLLRIRDGIYADDLVLAAVVRLDLLTVLSEDPGTLEDLCARHGIAYRPADVLCTLLRAMGLVESGAVLRPTSLARACLIRGAPYDLRPYLASGASRSTCLEQVELLRTGESTAWTGARIGAWPLDPAFGEHLSGAHARAHVLAPAVADLVEDIVVESMLEVAGSGACAKVMAERQRGVRVTPLDPYDLFEAFPTGHDVHLLSHVLHCWGDAVVQQIIGRSYDALRPGGWIIDYDMHLNADKSGPLPVARYSALLLHATEGQSWSVTEIAAFMADAGFVNVNERPCGVDRTAILGQKPESR